MSEKNTNELQNWMFSPETFMSVAHAENVNDFFMKNDTLFALIDDIPDGISIVTLDMEVAYMNQSMKYWFPTSPGKKREKCYKIFHGTKTPCKDCPVCASRLSGKPEGRVLTFSSGGGFFGYMHINAIPVLNGQKEIAFFIEYVHNLTFQKSLEQTLSRFDDQFQMLKQQNEMLIQALKKRDAQLAELEQTVNENMKNFVKPAIEQLEKAADANGMGIVSSIIEEAVFPITQKHSSGLITLTPREMQVATMIRDGYSSKDIAQELFLTKKAVDYHRANIRKKLKLDRGQNLETYLRMNM